MSRRSTPLAGSTGTGVMVQTAAVTAAAAVAWVGGGEHPGRAAAMAFAASVCLGGVVGGWAAARWQGATPAARVSATLAVVALRVFPALAALGWLQTPAANRLRDAGAGELLVAFYLVVLATDVFLNIMGARGSGPDAGPTRLN